MPLRRSILLCLGLRLVSPVMASEPGDEVSPWATLAQADLAAIRGHVLAIHPAVRDPQNPDFVVATDAAYRAAVNRAKQAQSFLDWRATVGGFIP